MKKYSKKSILNIQRIGIPRGFYYYLYPGLWEIFFRGIGIEPVLTEKSSRRTLELAVPCSESEHCLAHKIFDGHLKSLQDQVDAVFIPRLLSMKKRHICCAKFGALPDASRLGAASLIPVISVELNENRESLTQTLTRLAKNLGVDKAKAQRSVSARHWPVWRKKRKNANLQDGSSLQQGGSCFWVMLILLRMILFVLRV